MPEHLSVGALAGSGKANFAGKRYPADRHCCLDSGRLERKLSRSPLRVRHDEVQLTYFTAARISK